MLDDTVLLLRRIRCDVPEWKQFAVHGETFGPFTAQSVKLLLYNHQSDGSPAVTTPMTGGERSVDRQSGKRLEGQVLPVRRCRMYQVSMQSSTML